MSFLYRTGLTVTRKRPYIDWANGLDEDGPDLTPELAGDRRTIYLVPESDDEPALACFRGKVASLLSASPGGLGGLRGLVHLRAILGNIGIIVLPDQVAVARAHEAFQPDGSLTEPAQQASIEALGKTLASILMKLRA